MAIGRPRKFLGSNPAAVMEARQLSLLITDLRLLYDRRSRDWVSWERQALLDAIDNIERQWKK